MGCGHEVYLPQARQSVSVMFCLLALAIVLVVFGLEVATPLNAGYGNRPVVILPKELGLAIWNGSTYAKHAVLKDSSGFA